MNTTYWIQHFQENAEVTRGFTLPADPCRLPDSVRVPLARSIAIFQLGESGGGTRLRRYARKIAPLENFKGYLDAMDLFIAEEQGHSRVLGSLLQHLGGTPIQKQWTNSVFRRLRVLVNVEFNIQVLLTAELIAEVYFGSLYLRVSDPAVRQVSRKLLSDEMKHLVFQRQFLSERLRDLSPLAQHLWRWQFICVHRIATWVVAWDHADCLRAIGLTPKRFRQRAAEAIGTFSRKLWQSVRAGTESRPVPLVSKSASAT